MPELLIKMTYGVVDTAVITAPVDGECDFFVPVTPKVRGVPPASALGRTGPPRPALPMMTGPQPKASRWAKSDTTFGPFGRVLSTLALFVPFLFLAAAGIFTFDPFVLGGACVWAVLMAMGLRQVWQAVQHHHGR